MKKPKINAYGLRGWRLPKATYKRARWLVSDYPRIKAEYENLLTDTPDHDGQPGSAGPGDPTAAVAARRAVLSDDVWAVEKALKAIPKEYAGGVFRHLTEGEQFPGYADRMTWYDHQAELIYLIARIKGY